MKTNHNNNILRKLPLSVTTTIIILTLTACGGKKDKTEETAPDLTYRYEHIDKIVNQYTDLLMSTPPDGMEMERLLMDINSRCEMLKQSGDTLTALYLHQAIEQSLRTRDNTLADRIFGTSPYSAFTM